MDTGRGRCSAREATERPDVTAPTGTLVRPAPSDGSPPVSTPVTPGFDASSGVELRGKWRVLVAINLVVLAWLLVSPVARAPVAMAANVLGPLLACWWCVPARGTG